MREATEPFGTWNVAQRSFPDSVLSFPLPRSLAFLASANCLLVTVSHADYRLYAFTLVTVINILNNATELGSDEGKGAVAALPQALRRR